MTHDVSDTLSVALMKLRASLAFLCEWRVVKPSLVVFWWFLYSIIHSWTVLRSEADAMIGEGKKLCYAKTHLKICWFLVIHPQVLMENIRKITIDVEDSASPWSIFLHFEGQNQSPDSTCLALTLIFQIASMLQIFHNSPLFSQVFTSDIYVFWVFELHRKYHWGADKPCFFQPHLRMMPLGPFLESPEAFDNCACADTDWLIDCLLSII